MRKLTPRRPDAPVAPAPVRKPRRVGGLLPLGLALVAGGLALAMAYGQAGGALKEPQAARQTRITVRLSSADQQRLDSWAEFFACHSLRSDQLIVATLRINRFAEDARWRPERPIVIDLAPSADLSRYTPAEMQVLEAVSALGSEALPAACSGRAAPEPASEEVEP